MPKAKPLPSKEFLNNILNYNAKTGFFYRKKTKCSRFVDMKNPIQHKLNGYYVIYIEDERYLAHRLAWKIIYGEDPKIIDHINGNKLDNRIKNLRNTNESGNSRNRKLNSNNKSGYRGVYYSKNKKKWCAEIYFSKNGKKSKKNIGAFTLKKDAILARKVAEKEFGFIDRNSIIL